MELSEKIKDFIVSRREQLGINRYQLSKSVGMSYQQMMNVEKTGMTSTKSLEKIMDSLNTDIVFKVKETDENGNN